MSGVYYVLMTDEAWKTAHKRVFRSRSAAESFAADYESYRGPGTAEVYTRTDMKKEHMRPEDYPNYKGRA